MRVLKGNERAPGDLRGAAIALGVMDGVHLGHQAVIAEARAIAQATGVPLAAAVFEPHPRHHFQPDAPPFRLQSAAQRVRALEALGVEAVFEIPFGPEVAALSDDDFGREILSKYLGVSHVSVGFDFRYGRGRTGNLESLRQKGEALGFSVGVTAPVLRNGEKISSTAIRVHIGEGRMDEAAAMLSRPWAIEGDVIQGQQRGSTIGFPTANIALGAYQRPRFGVYAVRVKIDGQTHAGVANCGIRPTVEGQTPLLEAHVFDFSGDLYGKSIETQFIAFLRAEQKFENFDALKAQIAKDAEAAGRLFSAPES